MVEVKNLCVSSLSGRALLEDVNFVINKGDKLAIIGEEGNGKTTLMKAIYNKELLANSFVVEGEINTGNYSIGFLEQILNPLWDKFTPTDFFLKSTPQSEPDFDVFNHFGQISLLIKQLGLKDGFLDDQQQIGTLSGGEKVKMQLVKLMYDKPHLLLLDEPTNDLDIETLEMLEDFINNYNEHIIFVSHDETLLENTANCILHLEQLKRKSKNRATFETLDYKDYVAQRVASLIKQDQIATFEQDKRAEQLKITKEIKNKIQKANPGRTNSMRAIIAREARWEKNEPAEHSESEESIRMQFSHNTELPAKKRVIDLKLKKLSNEHKVLSKNVNLSVAGPEKIGIIGNNGCGKTTLIRQIYDYFNKEKPSGLKIAYMPQNYSEVVDEKKSIINFLCNNASKLEQEKVRAILGRLKFTSSEMLLAISKLSGGQKAKVFLTKLMITDSNVLLLDEPTRNLSPLSNPVVREFFKSYKGAIISISHDRKFLSQVCDKVYELTKEGLHERII